MKLPHLAGGGRRIQHGVADELGDAVGSVDAVGVGGLVPPVQETPPLPLPALSGLAHFCNKKSPKNWRIKQKLLADLWLGCDGHGRNK